MSENMVLNSQADDAANTASEEQAVTPQVEEQVQADSAEAGTTATEDASETATETVAEEAAEVETDSEEATEVEADAEAENEEDEFGDISFTDFIDNIPELRRGAIVKGNIVRYDDDTVYMDVKDKTEGKVPLREFTSDPDFNLDEAIADGREIDVYVRNIRSTDLGKEILLSKAKVDFGKNKAFVEEAYNEKTPIEVKVINVVKDGLIATYGGVDIYIHRTQIDMNMIKDLEPYRGETLEILVTQFDAERKRLRVSGSRRALLNQQRKSRAKEVWETIEVGDIYEGVVRNLTDFGAFVDIGGVDGLVHISELSWKRIKHPSEVISVGDVIQVYVKDFDKERKRISLGYRRIEDDPYHNIEERFPVGSIIKGKVVRMFNFGAFVELEDGVDALCHISQISTLRLNRPEEVLEVGMEVEARVIEVSNEERKISISIRDVAPIDTRPDGSVPETHEAGNDNEGDQQGGRRRGRGGRERDNSPTSYRDDASHASVDSSMLEAARAAGLFQDEEEADEETTAAPEAKADVEADSAKEEATEAADEAAEPAEEAAVEATTAEEAPVEEASAEVVESAEENREQATEAVEETTEEAADKTENEAKEETTEEA